jgi:2-isopropylmalate synthase
MFSAINRRVKLMALRYQKGKPLVRISDTTLRDGLQTPGVRVDVPARVQIAQALAEAGVHSIDCGFPASSQSELQAVQAIAKHVKGCILSAHTRTKREDIDASAEALSGVSPFRRAATLFIGISPLHRDHKHGLTKAQVIDTVVRSVEYAQSSFEMISFGPEDASRTEPDFLSEVYEKVIQAGALSIGFTDTVGILTPSKVSDAIKRIQDTVPSIGDAMLAVHFHNDLGLATANALAAIRAGANIVQGTVNGMGERAGNTAIEEVVMALTLHNDEFGKVVSVDASRLSSLCQLVAQLTGFAPSPNKAVVGRNIFRTETGVHQNGQLKHPDMYLPFQPEVIGAAPLELLLGHNSGKSAVRHHLVAAGLEPSDEHVDMILGFLKNGRHDQTDQPEIQQFMDRIRPFVASGELRVPETLTPPADA